MLELVGKERQVSDPAVSQAETEAQLQHRSYESGKRDGIRLARTKDATKIVDAALSVSGLVSNPQEASKVRNAMVELATHIGNNLEGIDQPIK